MKKIDHRVRLTKQLIRESLIELMREMPISRISVKKLCEAADINRSTFYAHYDNPYDLLSQIQKDTISELAEYLSHDIISGQPELSIQVLSKILEYAKENSELFKVLLSKNGDFTFQSDIMRLAQERTIDDLRKKNLGKRTTEYLQLFITTGAINVIEKWMQDGMPESTQEIAELCLTLLYKGLSGYNKESEIKK